MPGAGSGDPRTAGESGEAAIRKKKGTGTFLMDAAAAGPPRACVADRADARWTAAPGAVRSC